MRKLAAILIFCAVPPLLVVAALGNLTVRLLAALHWIGWQRLLALVLLAWIGVGFLSANGLLGDLPIWARELVTIGYFCGAVGVPCLVGYWLIRWYIRKHGLDAPPVKADEPPRRRRGRRSSHG